MSNELQSKLESLRVTLVHTDAVDDATRTTLIQLVPEITRLLGRRTTNTEVHPLTEPLEKLAVQFEADHPALGSALRKVIDALANAGI